MKKLISDETRAVLAEKYIKWGSKLSFLNIEPFITLEHLRQYQFDIQEKEMTKKTLPPTTCELDLVYIRLIEVFHLEDFDQLVKGLQRLFPNLEDSFLHGKFRSEFFQGTNKIHGGAWLNLGTIVRERKKRLFGGDVRDLLSLPEEVDFISVELHQILPSMMVVLLDVHLTEIATHKLKELRSRVHYPKVRFRHLIPTGPVGGGFSRSSPDVEMRLAILKYLANLRSSVEMSLEPFVAGYFMRQKPINKIHLPAIEVYTLEGIPRIRSKLLKWIQDSRLWLRTIGFDFLSFEIYSNGKLFLIPWDEGGFYGDTTRLSHQLIISPKPYLKNINLDMYQGNKRFAIAHHTRDLLNGMLTYFSVYHIIVEFQKEFEKIRDVVFKSMKPERSLGYWLGKYIALNNRVIRISMIHDRLSKELLLEKNRILYDLRSLEELKTLEVIGKREPQSWSNILHESVEYRLNILKEHIAITSGWFTQYLALRNIAVTYMLAVIAGIAAIISILLNLLK